MIEKTQQKAIIWFFLVPALTKEIPRVKASAHLCARIATRRKIVPWILFWRPNASPSKNPWNPKAIKRINGVNEEVFWWCSLWWCASTLVSLLSSFCVSLLSMLLGFTKRSSCLSPFSILFINLLVCSRTGSFGFSPSSFIIEFLKNKNEANLPEEEITFLTACSVSSSVGFFGSPSLLGTSCSCFSISWISTGGSRPVFLISSCSWWWCSCPCPCSWSWIIKAWLLKATFSIKRIKEYEPKAMK